jgi:hypothetical protein
MRILLGVYFIAVLFPFSAIAQGESKPLTLCNFFQRLDSHNGQRVTISGAYRYGFEVSGLYSDACIPPAILDGREIVPHVYLVFLPIASLSEVSAANMAKFEQAVDESRTKPVSIYITVTGVLTTVSQSEPLITSDGRRMKVRMFGHLGAFPAQLNISSVDAIAVSINEAAPAYFDLKNPKR